MKEIKLTQGKVAIVDDADYERLSRFKWYAVKFGLVWYVARNFGTWPKKRLTYIHREITNAPHESEVDHIDGDGLNNRRSNLRLATKAQNLFNRGKHSDNSSGFKGVWRHKQNNKWRAGIMVDGKRVYLGLFTDKFDAARAYDEAARKHQGEFARLNFPDAGEPR